jgi:hypothetical protein
MALKPWQASATIQATREENAQEYRFVLRPLPVYARRPLEQDAEARIGVGLIP